ncbi:MULTISPECIES: DUF922 domain-containing protein [Olivibacter]|uniref:DUF922 domain-containing protein n=1 Tax=Olivibacter jilunii TaxID=985016 RepID=A0ABW6AZ19_9SPHI|nr:DUF922 domain-containing protein [Olivibacter sp. 47]MCL4641312.1 DUF922 domain-containing Zn-dependent protease [Olivibacter sp. UJ_SKK_5.1]MDM8174590.1 DUF922 domain-containing protein [Olivibacter sp. 47]MDX3913655.1 DUF922 domain-containing protein [Pseudosphingobacterium sp.]
MLKNLVYICSLSLLLFATVLSSCNKANAQGYRQLTISDFKGKADPKSPFISHVKLRIGYQSTTLKRVDSYQVTFHVFLDINPRESWIKFDKIKTPEVLAEVLNHEQGHFKIGLLMQHELISRLNARKYTSHYKQEAATLFNKVSNKYQAMQLRYDAETEHMMNRAQQAIWDKKLNRSIEGLNLLMD